MDDEAAILLSQLLTDSSHSRNKRIHSWIEHQYDFALSEQTHSRSPSPHRPDSPLLPAPEFCTLPPDSGRHSPQQPLCPDYDVLFFPPPLSPDDHIERRDEAIRFPCSLSFTALSKANTSTRTRRVPATKQPSTLLTISSRIRPHIATRPSFMSHRQAVSTKDSGCEEDGVAEAKPPALPPKPVPVGVHANGSAGEDGAAGEMAHLEAEDECGERNDPQGGEAFSSLMQTLPSTMLQAQTQTQTPPLARSKSMRSVKSVKSARSMRFGSKIPVPVPSPASTSTTGASASSGGVPEVPRIQRWLGAGEQEREHETTTFPLSPPPTPLSPSFSSYPPPSPLSPTSLASPTLPSWPHPKPSHAYSYHAESPRAKEQRQKQTSALGGFALSILKKRRRGPVVVVGEMGEGARDGG
ncbi:hypothetical protein SERLADRAFT_412762 [Serpula lacrymans var. lacrymans S7.9]|uniref:Uncharacterized protein n=1 Tax=Serpula lacrymans var. lacrymans (strain S7.9) TaxID=578457 RepID=F8NHI0_SERL9|nr:uncharacterized protein SERLADRAFT_412762 [Serpula lacrymans var. lacrymans S7.9]EGO29151.1 hypothetical protein SERLADRAFT_412762 [Serpula lacrymans var. lacrymans S7.9]